MGEIYRVPNKDMTTRLNSIDETLNNLAKEKDIIIGTDQNINYLNMEMDNNASNLFNTFMSYGFLPVITKPTRITDHSATLIDNMYINVNNVTHEYAAILTIDISDHFPIVLSIRSNHKENTGDLIIEKRTFDNSAIDTIKNLLKCTDWQSLYNTNVHEMFQIITDKVTEYINICAPLKKYKIPQKYIKREKWITQGILKSSNTLDK